jgi:hypothetical protein
VGRLGWSCDFSRALASYCYYRTVSGRRGAVWAPLSVYMLSLIRKA